MDARLEYRRAADRWRAAGGYKPVGGEPSHPELYASVEAAWQRWYELSERAKPPNADDLLRRVRNGDPLAVEAAIAWLKVDPFARDTGYYKQKLMRRLGQTELREDHKHQLRQVLLQACTRGKRHEFPEACRLARRQLASEAFARDLDQSGENNN